jgi:two-component system, response regulator PdtaR
MLKTVLVVEDEFFTADYIADTLRNAGWRVLGPAYSAKDAFRLLSVERPSVAVLDVMLHQHLSTEVAVELQKLRIPFVLSTALQDPWRLLGTAAAGVPNIGKPVDAERLLDTLLKMSAPTNGSENESSEGSP